MSAAYYEAFTHLAGRLRAGEISPDDHVFSVDADGQHELAVFDELAARMESEPPMPDKIGCPTTK